MASATFEEHPTDPDKVIFRKPRLDQGADYERGFIDGMQYQMQTSVDKAVNAMSKQEQGKPVAWMQITKYGNKLLAFTEPPLEPPCYTGEFIAAKNYPLFLKKENT